MITMAEKVFVHADFAAVRTAFIAAARREAGRVADDEGWLRDRGYEPVEVDSGSSLTHDGREVLRLRGQPWALRPETHAKRLAEAIDQARQRDAAMAAQQEPSPPKSPTVCSALIDGQLCGGTLVRAAVCPRCALGKMGVDATMTCDVCGHVTAIMRGDS